MEKRYSVKDEEFYRKLILPEEERSHYTSAKWDGSFRWFRSPNVVCIEHFRRQPQKPMSDGTAVAK